MRAVIYCDGYCVGEITTNSSTVRDLEAAGFRVVITKQEVR